MERKTAAQEYHEHLDKCRQCHDHPFEPCPEGERLLARVAQDVDRRMIKEHGIAAH